MRAISRIFLHCSATPEGRDVTVEEIRKWHRERGWEDVGYHWVIYRDGTVKPGRPETKVGAHAAGHNVDSIGICYIGGCTADGAAKDTRTPEQIRAMDEVIDGVRHRHGQHITVHGHNEVSGKACPSFDVVEDRKKRRR